MSAPAIDLAHAEASAAELAAAHSAEAAEASELVCAAKLSPNEAAALLKDVQGRIRALEDLREGITRPLLEAKRKVEALFKPALVRYAALKDHLKREVAKEVDKRRDEQRKLLAEGNAREAVAIAPMPVQTRQVVKWKVVDAAKVPREFLTVDARAVQQALEEGLTVDGIESWKETTVVAR